MPTLDLDPWDHASCSLAEPADCLPPPAAENDGGTEELTGFDCRYASDDMLVRQGGEGQFRYFRAQRKEPEEYSYRRPFTLELELTRRCNLACVHCYARADESARKDELSLQEIVRVLDDARALGIRELSLTGGEALLRSDFLRIVDAGLGRGFAVRLVTNGTLLDDRILCSLASRPFKLVTVSLDGASPREHELIRGGGTHAPTMRAIRRLLEAGFTVSIITAFSRLNLNQFAPLLALCVELRVTWQVQLASAKGHCPRKITLTPARYYGLGEQVAYAYTSSLPIRVIPMDDLATFSHLYPLSVLSRTWQRRCTGGLLNLFVRANGDVTPCSALAFPQCVVGNVRRESIAEICLEERCKTNLAWLNLEQFTGACARCPFRLECFGGCPEILLSMCAQPTENEYCYHRIEEQRILAQVLDNNRLALPKSYSPTV